MNNEKWVQSLEFYLSQKKRANLVNEKSDTILYRQNEDAYVMLKSLAKTKPTICSFEILFRLLPHMNMNYKQMYFICSMWIKNVTEVKSINRLKNFAYKP